MKYARILGFPALAAVAIVLASLVPDHEEDARPPSAVDVTQATYACPASSGFIVAAGQVEAGQSAASSVLPKRSSSSVLNDASSWRTEKVAGDGVVIQQRGRASGAVGFLAGTASKADGGGLVVGACSSVVDEAWFMGLGSGGKHFSTLTLTNLADSTAVVDLRLWGPQGQIDAVNATGIAVEPYSVRRVRLDALAAGEPELAVEMLRRRGSLSVTALDTSTATFQGTEAVSGTATPRRDQVVSGLVKGASGRTLLILNPGTTTSRVSVSFIGAKETVVLSGLDNLKVEAGTVRVVTVPKAAGGEEGGLRLTSDQPVVATVRMAAASKDYAYAEAAPALSGPTVVPIDVGAGLTERRLVLSAPDKAASVEVELFDAEMTAVDSSTVSIDAGTTASVKLSSTGVAYAVLRPQGTVFAAATYLTKTGISSLALTGAPITVFGPQVRPVN